MKKSTTTMIGVALLLGATLQSCFYGSTGSYFGTMAGAEIGGVIGESIGWMSTSRHGGPGGALMGRVVGTVAGSVIGNSIAQKAEEGAANRRAKRKEKKNRQNENSTYYYDNNDEYAYGDNETYTYANGEADDNMPVGGFQIEGGASMPGSDTGNFSAPTQQLVISNLRYEDENGDGKISKYETINVIYELTNKSNQTAFVTLVTGNDRDANLEFSPAHKATVEPGKTIRYKAKVFCKKFVKAGYVEIPVLVTSNGQGSASQSIRIKTSK